MFRAPSVNSSVPLRLQQCDTAAGCVGGCICSRVDSEKNTADILQLLNVCSCHLFVYFPSTYITLPTGSTFAELNVDFSGAQAVIALWWSAQVITQIDFHTLTRQTQQPGTSIHLGRVYVQLDGTGGRRTQILYFSKQIDPPIRHPAFKSRYSSIVCKMSFKRR